MTDFTPIATEGRKRKRDDNDESPWAQFTTVLVGPDEKKFMVHTHVLRKIKFFRGCLDAGMRESQEHLIRLPEDRADVFTQIIHWLYHDRLEFDIESDVVAEVAQSPTTRGFSTTFSSKTRLIVRLHCFAKKLCSDELQNYTVDILRHLIQHVYPSWWNYRYVNSHLDPEDGLYRMFAQELARQIHRKGWESFKKNDSRYTGFACSSQQALHFTFDAAMTYRDAICPSAEKDSCKFHTHIDTQKCS